MDKLDHDRQAEQKRSVLQNRQAEETLTLAGQEAVMGVRSQPPYWDYVLWHGALEGVAAVQDLDTAACFIVN